MTTINNVSISDKIKLDCGDEYFIIEQEILRDDTKNESRNNNSIQLNKSKIKIVSVKKPISTVTIVLTRNNEYVGHIGARLHNDSSADMIMSVAKYLNLPDEITRYSELVEKDIALLVNEKYRRQGKAKELITLLFEYLDKKGIRDLEVQEITNDVAMQTYLNTGAERTSDKTAIYKNIRRFIRKEKGRSIER